MICIIKCAWCDKTVGEKKLSGNFDTKYNVTHSICEDCKAKLMDKLEQDEKEVENVRWANGLF